MSCYIEVTFQESSIIDVWKLQPFMTTNVTDQTDEDL